MTWLILLLWASTAYAVNPLLLSSFDVIDNIDSTTNTDVLDMQTIETTGGGASDGDVEAAQCTTNSFRCRLDTNGGSSSSRFAGALNLASGERGGWEQPLFLAPNALEGTLGFAVHWYSGGGASGEREMARWTMGAGATQGCNVRLTATRTFKLYWGATLIGTAESTLQTNACSDNPQRGCASGADCVSTICSTCSTTTGAGCFWPTLELVQMNSPSASGSGDQVRCQLWVQGVLEADSGTISAGTGVLGALTGYEVGGPGTEAATLQLGIDDLVVIPSTRAGNSYLHWMTPTEGIFNGAVASTCGGSGRVMDCIGDWGSVTLNNYRNFGTGVDNTIRTGTAGNGATVTRFAPQPTALPAGATIPAVATPVVGRTGSGASWITRTRLVQCSTLSTCESQTPPFDMDHGAQTIPILVGFPVADAPPTHVGAWSVPQVATLGTIWTAQAVSGGNAARECAVGAVVQIKRQDGEVVANLRDRNIGTDDGRVLVQAQGDSTGAGTGASTCQLGSAAGIACNQETYCSWDANKSKPVGGCSGASDCQTCTLRRLEYNSGAGYHCAADADCNLGASCTAGSGNCGDGSGTCSGSTADNVVTCGCAADCQLGTCATTATCEISCPGGSCPSRSGWPVYAQFVSDDYLNCSQDGWTTNLVAGQLTNALYGRQATCKLVRGNTGHCTCAADSECQVTSGGTCDKPTNGRCKLAVWTACTTDADCPAGDTCLGLCTASDNGRATCTGPKVGSSATDACATAAQFCTGAGTPDACCTAAGAGETCFGRVCAFGRPDYLMIGTGLNDMNPSEDTSDCRRAYTAGDPNDACDSCTETACIADSACTGLSAASRCFGTLGQNAAGSGCMAGGGCSADTHVCALDSDCRAGQTCTGWTGSPEPNGYCTCDANGDCLNNTLGPPFGYKCVNPGPTGLCRLKCTTNADCGAVSGVCDMPSGTCQGQCSCPCDAASCSVDADCRQVTVNVFGFWPIRTTAPKCVGGKCSQCAMTHCASSPNQQAYLSGYWRYSGGTFWNQKYRQMNATIATEAARTGDSTTPLLIPMSFPDATSGYYPLCRGGFVGDAKNASSRMRLQVQSEFPIWIDAAMAVNVQPDNLIYVDGVHPGAYGASVWGAPAGVILSSLNVCSTGTGAKSVAAAYCKNLDGTWDTGGAGYTLCTATAQCAGTDTCVARTCTVNDDSASGCPGAPTCNLEP